MLKRFGSILGALHVAHAFAAIGAAAGALTLIGYLVAFAGVDALDVLARRVRGRGDTTKAAR